VKACSYLTLFGEKEWTLYRRNNN